MLFSMVRYIFYTLAGTQRLGNVFSYICLKAVVGLLLFPFVLTSCGVDGHRFKVEGRFLNLNQGEFYVYSTDGAIDGIDTIKLEGGRFVYEIPCTQQGTLVVVFPNFSEQPIFTQPGKSVEMEGDASHLKEMTVKGTKDNELMNRFRESIVNASPPEMMKYAEMFANDHAASPVSTYLVRRYFIATSTPDYSKALRLVQTLLAAQPKNGTLVKMREELQALVKIKMGSPLPAFSGIATSGEKVSQAALNKAPFAVVSVWSTYNPESTEMQRMLQSKFRTSKGKLKLLSICMDANRRECTDMMKHDSISWPNICDGRMFEGTVAKQLGICTVPYHIVLKNGKIVAKGLNTKQLQEKLESML